MRSRAILIVLTLLILAGVFFTLVFLKRNRITPVEQTAVIQLQPAASASPSVLASASPSTSALPSSNPSPDLGTDPTGLSNATVTIGTSKGDIKIKLFPKDAPNTVKRFVELVQQGFYNGLIFHRVEPGFVVQGGDPQGTGKGGSGQKLKAEFNDRRHVEGTVAMARFGSDPDSADSQFYITLSPQPQLDHSYTVFGQVTEGMDVVKKLQVGDRMTFVIVQ